MTVNVKAINLGPYLGEFVQILVTLRRRVLALEGGRMAAAGVRRDDFGRRIIGRLSIVGLWQQSDQIEFLNKFHQTYIHVKSFHGRFQETDFRLVVFV